MARLLNCLLPILVLALAAIPFLTIGVPANLAATSTSAIEGVAAIDPRVLEDTEDGQSAKFLVVLRTQAAAREAAARAGERAAQGEAVYSALRQTAAASQLPVARHLATLGARARPLYIVNAVIVEGDRRVVEAMVARPDVLRIASDRAFRVPLETPSPAANARALTATSSDAVGIEWNIMQTGAPKVWQAGYTGQSIVYANADTGVQWAHPALKPQYAGWDGFAADHNYAWWDAVHDRINPAEGDSSCGYNAPAPCDDFGHGTHTMGTGVGDDGFGNQIGMAPGARWIACRNMERGWGRPSTYLECLQFFLAPWDQAHGPPNATGVPTRRPDVVSNSYVCAPVEGCTDPSLVDAAVENLRAAGIFVAASAGNDGPGCSTVNQAPGVAVGAATVGAVDSKGVIAGFSSRGPVTSDSSGRLKPDLSAPGVGVRASYPLNGWATLSGTSMAAPHVAGAVALLWSAYPGLRRDVEQTMALLEASAAHVTTTQGCGGDTSSKVPNNVYGYGLLSVAAAYALGIEPVATRTPTPNYPYHSWLPVFLQ